MLGAVALLLHKKAKMPDPPVGDREIAPSLLEDVEQFIIKAVSIEIAGGCTMVTSENTATHPPASVTVKPSVNGGCVGNVVVAVVSPLDHKYWYGGVPPIVVAVAVMGPKQVIVTGAILT